MDWSDEREMQREKRKKVEIENDIYDMLCDEMKNIKINREKNRVDMEVIKKNERDKYRFSLKNHNINSKWRSTFNFQINI